MSRSLPMVKQVRHICVRISTVLYRWCVERCFITVVQLFYHCTRFSILSCLFVTVHRIAHRLILFMQLLCVYFCNELADCLCKNVLLLLSLCASLRLLLQAAAKRTRWRASPVDKA